MANIRAYDDMIGALGKFYKEIMEVNSDLLNQTNAMQTAMDDDYGEELCGQVEKFIDRMKVLLDDVLDVQRALDDRMNDIFG